MLANVLKCSSRLEFVDQLFKFGLVVLLILSELEEEVAKEGYAALAMKPPAAEAAPLPYFAGWERAVAPAPGRQQVQGDLNHRVGAEVRLRVRSGSKRMAHLVD